MAETKLRYARLNTLGLVSLSWFRQNGYRGLVGSLSSCILSGILCRLLFWLLSGDIMRYNELFCEYFLCPMNLCNSAHYHPFVLVSSLTMQRGQSEVFVAFFSKIAQGTSVRRRDRGPSHKHVCMSGNSTFLQFFSRTLAALVW